MRPYTPLELAGRNIYIREGCYVCHSQMIRPFRDEVERYGHYSLAAESMYDHPFQWGSKRTGPDLARVGNRYSNEWHVEHLTEPRSVVPESIMPSYSFLKTTPLKVANVTADLNANALVGVPYSEEMIANAEADLAAGKLGHVDHVGAGQLVVQLVDPAFDEALLLLGRMILGVLRKVAMRTRFGDRRDDVRAFHRFQGFQLGLKRSMAFGGHGDAFHGCVTSVFGRKILVANAKVVKWGQSGRLQGAHRDFL